MFTYAAEAEMSKACRISLKTKIVIAVTAVVTLSLGLTALLIEARFGYKLKETVSNQQFSLVSTVAEDVDEHLFIALKAVSSLAATFDQGDLTSTEKMKRALFLHRESLQIFNGGMYIIDAGGLVRAEIATSQAITGRNFSGHHFFRNTLSTGNPGVSMLPVTERGQSSIIFTAPVFGREGKVTGVVGGEVDLLKKHFLSHLMGRKIGRTGYFFLYGLDRTMIIHPDKSRIMKQDVPPGMNKGLDKAISGFEGTDETINSRGRRMLASFKRLSAADWILGANFPVEEAYEAVNQARRYLLLALLPSLGITILLIFLVMKYLTRPLLLFTDHVKALPRKKGDDKFICFRSNDEIGALAAAFNDLVGNLERQEEAARRHSNYLAALNETAVGLIGRSKLETLLQDIMSRLLALMGTDHGFIYLVNQAGTLNHHTSTGIFAGGDQGVIPREFIQSVMQGARMVAVEDSDRWRRPDGAPMLRAMLGLPLKVADQVVGVIGLALEREKMFGEEEITVLTSFAELASVALNNVRLHEEAQQELKERRRVEAELRKLSHAIEQSPASIMITDPAGNIEYVNPKFSEVTGYEMDEVIGRNPRFLKSGHLGKEEYLKLWDTISKGGEWSGELHNRKKNGEFFWELATISSIKDDLGNIIFYMAVKEDITERKKLESQLRHSQKMEAVGQLAGGVAHDFSNILTAVIGYASIIDLQLPHESPLKNPLDQIKASTERGAKLIQGLLSFSRKQVSYLLPIQLNDIVRRVEKLLARVIGEDILLQSLLTADNTEILADSVQIEQLIMNLATNARDAMPRGGTLLIETAVADLNGDAGDFRGKSKSVVLRVSDTGVGMTEEIRKRIFEPFFTTKQVGKGTGLGLSIAYGIVKSHNGTINCSSGSGNGTIFTISFPANWSRDKRADPSAGQGRAPRGSETVLLAEDADSIRILLKDTLEEAGYTVIDAADGEEAVEKFKQHRESIGLLILDAVMPIKNGREVYSEIRAMSPDIRVIFNSGYCIDTISRKGLLETEKDFLAKPFTPGDLLVKMREVLDK